MGNNCCAGPGTINEYDLNNTNTNKQSPIVVHNLEKRLEIIKGNMDRSLEEYSIADGCQTSFANASDDKSQTKATTNSNYIKSSKRQNSEFTPRSGRKRGSRVKMPSQDLEDSPNLRVTMDQHPNPMESADLHYIDSDSEANCPDADKILSDDIVCDLEAPNMEQGARHFFTPFPVVTSSLKSRNSKDAFNCSKNNIEPIFDRSSEIQLGSHRETSFRDSVPMPEGDYDQESPVLIDVQNQLDFNQLDSLEEDEENIMNFDDDKDHLLNEESPTHIDFLYKTDESKVEFFSVEKDEFGTNKQPGAEEAMVYEFECRNSPSKKVIIDYEAPEDAYLDHSNMQNKEDNVFNISK